MTVAFTLEAGESEGEYLRELNPEWVKRKKEMQKQMEKVNR